MYRRRFGAVMGLVSFIGVLLFGWWLFAANLLMALWIFIPSPLPGFNWDVLLMVLGFFFMGLLLIIWGLTTYSMRGHTRIPSLATITAILFIASAAGYLVQLGPLSYMITIYDITSFVLAAGALLLIAGILNALIFFTMPTEHV